MAFNHLVGGRGSNQSASYFPVQIVLPPYPVALPPNYAIHSPGVVGVGEAPAIDATHRILNASTATLPTGWSEARSTTATYYNSSGVVSTASSNTLRNDYTSAGSLRGYLLESAATNIMIWSSTITAAQVPWHETTGNATVTSTNVSDPAGGTTASTVNFVAAGGTGGAGGAVYQQQIAVSLGTVYTFSAWMRSSASGGASFVRFATNNSLAWNTGMGQKFTLTSTWTRYTMTGVVLSSAGGAGNVINIGFDSREPVGGTWDNTIAGNVDVWGPQLELGTAATSYNPTTSAAVTRAADIASFTLDAAATDLALTYDDGSVTIYTGVPPGSTFNVPTSSTLRLLYVDDNVAAAGSAGSASGVGSATAEGTGIVAAVGAAAGSGTASGVVVGLSSTDKNAAINVSADGLTASLSSTPGGDAEGRGNTAGVANSVFEVVFSGNSGGLAGCGIANSTQGLSVYTGSPNGMAYYADNFYEGPGGVTGNAATYTTGDVITWELLASTAKVYKNGVLQVTFPTLPSGSLYPIVSLKTSGDSATFNFGAKAFSYLPSGDTGWNGLTQLAGNVGAASGSGTATAVGASTAASQGASAGSATVTAVGASTAASVGSATGTGAATAVGASTAASVGSAAGSGAATAVGASTARSVGAAAGSGVATATAGLVGAAAGSGAATAVGASTAASVGSSAGSGTATAVGASTARSVGAAAGSGAATAASISSAIGSAAGTGTATAAGVSTAAGIGSAAGTETVIAVGAATDASDGASSGTSTASAVGASTASGVGASAGSGAATSIGAATAAGVGSAAGHATATAFTGIVAQAAGSGTATGTGASTAAAVGSAAGTSTVTAASSSASAGSAAGIATASGIGQATAVAIGSATGVGSASGTSTGVTISAVGSSSGSGTASATSPAAETTIVSAIGAAAGSGDSVAFAPSIDFSDDFGDDFATLLITLPEQKDFGSDFSFDFATFYDAAFNEDFGDDFAVRHITQDFSDDFSNDFAVHHGIQTIVSGVGVSAGASIVSGHISTDVETPPVYPLPPPPIPLVWHPAIEYRRVQPPRAIRIHRRGTELRKAIPRSMKRRYG